MKLFTRWQNSAGERVRIALHLKGIEYQYVSVQSLPPGEYRRINPQGLLPTLEVDGRFVAQSAAILEFLEEAHPLPALLPADPILRAQARSFGAHIAAEMHAITVNRVRQFLEAELERIPIRLTQWPTPHPSLPRKGGGFRSRICFFSLPLDGGGLGWG